MTHHGHRIFLLVISDELILQSWVREKMLMAFFRISRSCCTRSNSRYAPMNFFSLRQLMPFARKGLMTMFLGLLAPAIQSAIGYAQFSGNLRFWFPTAAG
jgi:hypothetical protein